MVDHEARVHPERERLAREDQLARKIALVASDRHRLGRPLRSGQVIADEEPDAPIVRTIVPRTASSPG